jgi:hypothetical protein
MKTQLTFLLTFLFLFSGSAFVYAKSALLTSKKLKCSFTEGIFTDGQDGKFSGEANLGV